MSHDCLCHYSCNSYQLIFLGVMYCAKCYVLLPPSQIVRRFKGKICPKLYVVLRYQCNVNVTFPIITLTIYYSFFFQFFHLYFSYYLLKTFL